jgi:hypothetical protein
MQECSDRELMGVRRLEVYDRKCKLAKESAPPEFGGFNNRCAGPHTIGQASNHVARHDNEAHTVLKQDMQQIWSVSSGMKVISDNEKLRNAC